MRFDKSTELICNVGFYVNEDIRRRNEMKESRKLPNLTVFYQFPSTSHT